MSEPSASRDTEEVTAAVGHKIQIMTSLITELVTLWSQRSAEKARALQAQAETAERASRDRMKALRDGDMPIMRQVWNERWWDRASTEEIGLVWETTGGWARNNDPYARRTQEHLREQIKTRFGVELADEPVSHTLVTQTLVGSEAERPVSFVIRDAQSDTVVERGTLALEADDRRPLGVVAADRIGEFTPAQQDDGSADRYVIEVYDVGLPGGERRQIMNGGQAAALREEYDEWAQRVLDGTEAAPLDRVRDVYLVERRRLRRELDRLRAADPRVEAARETLAEEIAVRQGRDSRTAPARESERLSVEEHAAQMASLEQRMEAIQLRVDKVTADLVGEDVALVTEAAALRRDLDSGWWQTATSEEVAGIWTHVDRWSDGAAKDRMQTELQGQILRHHGVDVGPGASFEKVSGELQRAQADKAGERILRYRIESPGPPRTTPEGFAAPAATVEATGTVRVPKDTTLQQAAHGQLRTYAGDLTGAQDRHLVIQVADHSGSPLGSWNATGQIRDPIAQRGSTARDLIDVDALQRIADTGPEATDAVESATRSRPAWPTNEPPASGGLHRNGTDDRGLGQTRPRSWDRMNPHRQPETER